MRTLFHAHSEEHGECEAMFDCDGFMLGMWASNDATWRNEYFSPFMNALGFDIQNAPDYLVQELTDKAKELWGG